MRKTLKRTATGKYAERLEGMTEFAARVAKELLEAYPDVDYFDLEHQFNLVFGHQYARTMAHEFSKGEWRTQHCIVSSVEECIKFYSLGIGCEYEILEIKEVED